MSVSAETSLLPTVPPDPSGPTIPGTLYLHVGIVIEGINVLNNVGSIIMGLIMLFELIYALALSFPDTPKYTFKFFQKVIMNLDGHKLNAKIHLQTM